MNYKTNDQYKNLLGLIGKPLLHSFSKDFFTEKFEKEGLEDFVYDTFPIASIYYINILKRDNKNLKGLNVTLPYKETVIDFLDDLDETAEQIGAVNTIKVSNGKLKGYNTDAMAFLNTLTQFIAVEKLKITGALILGSGGASKAVKFGLQKMGISRLVVSRSEENGDITYGQLDSSILSEYNLIVNTTPLGTYPKVGFAPDIPFELLNSNNALYDLVYNPQKTLFLEKGIAQGCSVHGGLKMLHEQAELAWEIWTESLKSR